MRQRRPKNLEKRLEQCTPYLVENPEVHKGEWNLFFGNKKPIYVEVGCGKGKFIVDMAELHPDANFLGMEGQEGVLLQSLEKIQERELGNVLFIHSYLRDMGDYFAPGEVSGIYLNFSDPWPKARHAKRRLTHRGFLSGYREALAPGGFVELKTDNDVLYRFTLEELSSEGFEILETTENLHGSCLASGKVMTEYEEKFFSQGKNINYIKWR